MIAEGSEDISGAQGDQLLPLVSLGYEGDIGACSYRWGLAAAFGDVFGVKVNLRVWGMK